MQYTQTRGLRLSRFSLGTVQLGTPYGINNHTGKPSREQAFAILDRALELGVNSLDTSSDYGDSEEIIGQWLCLRSPQNPPLVVTKISRFDHSSLPALRASVRKKAEASMRRLKLDCLPLLMLHSFDDYAQNPEGVRIVFEELRRDGKIERWGVSAYSHHDYKLLAASGADAVQIPVNLFDWGRIRDGGLAALAGADMTVFARSVFLQGLIFQRPEELDRRMRFAEPVLRRFHELCAEFGMEPAVLALSFALSLPGVGCAVLGCERVEQVEQNAALIERAAPLTPAQMQTLMEAFQNMDRHVINPSTWYNA